jgi:putative IMPACT (imprinted ancient) family translation regulator
MGLSRGICEGCNQMTVVKTITDRSSLPEVQSITKSLRFCSYQCLVKYRNSVLNFLRPSHRSERLNESGRV